jgi:hypothetical protein
MWDFCAYVDSVQVLIRVGRIMVQMSVGLLKATRP